jgi:hypothetical protein
MNASRSALMMSAWVVHMPCDNFSYTKDLRSQQAQIDRHLSTIRSWCCARSEMFQHPPVTLGVASSAFLAFDKYLIRSKL